MSDIPWTLTPEIVSQHQTSSYVLVACTTLYTWDWLLAVHNECRMTRRKGHIYGYLSNVIYFVSRASTFTFLISILIISGASLSTCNPIAPILAASIVLSTSSTAALFLFRVSAIYEHNKAIMLFFGASWMVVVGLYIYDNALTIPGFTVLPGTRQCIQTGKQDASAALANAIFDTLVYLAISWRLASCSVVAENWRDRAKAFSRGDGLLGLSKSLLRSGQVYYFTTIGIGIFSIVTVYAPSVPQAWRSVLAIPNIVLQSVFACRVFRELKTGGLEDPFDRSGVLTSLDFKVLIRPRTLREDSNSGEGQPCPHDRQNSKTLKEDIEHQATSSLSMIFPGHPISV